MTDWICMPNTLNIGKYIIFVKSDIWFHCAAEQINFSVYNRHYPGPKSCVGTHARCSTCVIRPHLLYCSQFVQWSRALHRGLHIELHQGHLTWNTLLEAFGTISCNCNTLGCTNRTLPMECSKLSEINCTLPNVLGCQMGSVCEKYSTYLRHKKDDIVKQKGETCKASALPWS